MSKIVKAIVDDFTFKYDSSLVIEVTKAGVEVPDHVAEVMYNRFAVEVSDALEVSPRETKEAEAPEEHKAEEPVESAEESAEAAPEASVEAASEAPAESSEDKPKRARRSNK